MADRAPKPGAVKPPPESKPKPTPKRSAKPPGRPRSLEGRLEAALMMMAGAPAMAGDFYTAQVLTNAAPEYARAWATLAQENAQVKKYLENLLKGGAWGEVIMLTVAIAIPIGARYGIVPRGAVFGPFAAFAPAEDGVEPPSPADETGAVKPPSPPPSDG